MPLTEDVSNIKEIFLQIVCGSDLFCRLSQMQGENIWRHRQSARGSMTGVAKEGCIRLKGWDALVRELVETSVGLLGSIEFLVVYIS